MSIQLNKSKWASIAQAMMTLLWLPGILLINSCQGVLGVIPNNNALIKDGKQEAVNILAPSEVIVFCGNPGVGKSSLCNSIFQQVVFQSGISKGRGMTQAKQEYIYENRKYIDTPGLSDVNLRKQAAEEIEKALKENNNYKIIFVATLEAGRIRPDDLVTINTICEAIKTPFEYGIIFNKVIRPVIEEIGENGEGLKSYLGSLKK
jgi:GTP-binding protein EngB required for normal cell division